MTKGEDCVIKVNLIGRGFPSGARWQRATSVPYHIPLLLIFLLSLYSLSTLAQTPSGQPAVQFNDSVPVEARSFSEETIRQFQGDSDFDYGIRRKETLSWWERVKYWLAQQWSKLFQYTYFGTIYNIIFYIFCFSVIVFAILKLTGTSVTQLFRGRNDRGLVRGDGLEDDIHAIDFEREIAQARQDRDYRRGIRLLYIYTLKKLTDRQHIRWRPGKTNHDYQTELRDTPRAAPFEQLSYYYEYAWYGNFPADEALYQRVAQLVQRIDTPSPTPA